ncbi:hypothetical protein BZA77DRAFT_355111 [Pyronema omphalodes]|nr:hypothetical protein BZA77DRAFT_355111 [Pyronema omphalodes]
MASAITTAVPATTALLLDNFTPAFGPRDALALEFVGDVTAKAFAVPRVEIGVEIRASVPVEFTAPSLLVRMAVVRTLASVGHWSAEECTKGGIKATEGAVTATESGQDTAKKSV